MTSAQTKWGLTVAVAASLALAAGTARAEGEKTEGKPAEGTAKAEVKVGEGGEKAEAGTEGEKGEGEKGEGKEGEGEEKSVVAGLDLVLGWGNVPFATFSPGVLANPAQQQTGIYTRDDSTSSNVQSLIFNLGAEIAEHWGIGARIPVTWATFNPNGSDSRSTVAAGNVELEGEYGHHLGHGLKLIGALGWALPTAEGDEIPPDLAAPAGTVSPAGFDRFSLSKAAAAARGYEDNALFEPHRMGFIPKIALQYHTAGLTIEPYVKLENLVATSSALENNYVGELVGAVRVGYWVHRQFEVSAKVWFNTTYAGPDEDKKTSASVEPQLVLKFGSVRPYLGFIFPFAGPPNEMSFKGLRLGAAAAF